MRITDGNLFEAMRLVLPEHRSRMAEGERRDGQPAAPSADARECMEEMLAMALSHGLSVRLTLGGGREPEVLEGRLLYAGQLWMEHEGGTTPVAPDRLLAVDLSD